MNWKFTEPLKSEKLISEYEEKIGYRFQEDFRECVMENNGGYPEKKFFYSQKDNRRRKIVFNYLFSFNKNDTGSIWGYNDWRGKFGDWFRYTNGEIENYVVFAGDTFGNFIGFKRKTNEIVFIDHEQMQAEKIADSFTELLNSMKSK